ncbi:MAG TPA: phosphatidylglycerophosphatase A [Thermohalobaculum sp.]|nr:phosphatidylglycerophosphatase A [Thermohalobaculum sp.]
MSWARLAVTFGGVGLLPKAPGTWGSAAAIPLAWGLHWLGGFWLVGPATVAVCVLGYFATTQYLQTPDDDPSEVVIDEVAGMLIALWPLSLGLTLMGTAPHVFPWPGWVLGFLLFRFFDIVKPFPVGWADRLPGATGVMLDDLIAGAMAAVLAALAAGISHGWF